MVLSPYARRHRFRRSERLGNDAANRAKEGHYDRETFHLLTEAIEDMLIGLADLLKLKDGAALERATFRELCICLHEFIRREEVIVDGPMLAPFLTEASAPLSAVYTPERFLTLREAHKGLLYFASSLCADGRGCGSSVLKLSHLLERYTPTEIWDAMDEPSGLPGMEALSTLPQAEKRRLQGILALRQEGCGHMRL